MLVEIQIGSEGVIGGLRAQRAIDGNFEGLPCSLKDAPILQGAVNGRQLIEPLLNFVR